MSYRRWKKSLAPYQWMNKLHEVAHVTVAVCFAIFFLFLALKTISHKVSFVSLNDLIPDCFTLYFVARDLPERKRKYYDNFDVTQKSFSSKLKNCFEMKTCYFSFFFSSSCSFWCQQYPINKEDLRVEWLNEKKFLNIFFIKIIFLLFFFRFFSIEIIYIILHFLRSSRHF